MTGEPALGLFELGHHRHPSTVFHANGSVVATTDPVLSAVFVRLVLEGECPNCGGQGWTIEPGHVCNGDERTCSEQCPEPMQVQCRECS